MKKLSVVIICTIGLASSAWTLKEATQLDFEDLLEAIYNQWEEYVAYEALQEQLWECYHNPLSLNQVSKEELRLLCILTDDQLDQLFKHLAKNGPLISIYELQAIPGLDSATIQLLIPFVRVAAVPEDYYSRSLWHKSLATKNSYGLTRYERTLETKRGYQYNSKQNKVPYAGSANKLLTRLHINHPSGWELGISGRKEAGKALIWDPATQRYGLTSWRWHWLLNNKKRIKTIILGDYAVGYGQGVVLNAGFSIGKSSETIKVIRTNNLGIRPHTSMTTAAFRGVAVTWQWSPIELTTYYSNINLDNKVRGETCLSNVTSYSRTQREIAKKGKVNEQVIGGTLVYKGHRRGTELGINLLYNHYNIPIYLASNRNNPHGLCSPHHGNGSIFYRFLWQNFHFFGEGALSLNKKQAALAGVVVSLSRHVDATLLWRHYDQHFRSPYGKAFRENATSNSNETGIYIGAKIQPWQHLCVDAYYDYFRFPWHFGKPRTGHSWLAKTTCQISKASCICWQYKTTTKPRQHTKAAMGTRQHHKLFWQYTLNRSIHCKSEIQCSRYQQLGTPTWGYAAVQDVTYKMRNFQLRGYVAWFDVKKANNKLYFYEPNVLHTGFNFHAYQGEGMRYCLLIRYQPITIFRLELKYAFTHYKGVNTIGTGQETIKGNKKNDVTLQAIFKF